MDGERVFVTVTLGDFVPTVVGEGEPVCEDDLDDVGVIVKTAVPEDAADAVLDIVGVAVEDKVATVEFVGKGLELTDGVEVVDVVSELCAEKVLCADSEGVAVRDCANDGEVEVDPEIVTEKMEVILIEAQPDVVCDTFIERETEGDEVSDCRADIVLSLECVCSSDAVTEVLELTDDVAVSVRETREVNVCTIVTEGDEDEDAAAVADFVTLTDAVTLGDVVGVTDTERESEGDALDVDVGLEDITAESEN